MRNLVIGSCLLSLAGSIWGGMFIAVRLAIFVIPPVPLVWMRYGTALLALTARHKMKYLGWTGGTDPGKAYVFMNEKKEQRARAFAHTAMDGANVL